MTSKRNDLIRMLALNEIGDDYENFEYISNRVVPQGVECGIEVRQEEVEKALQELLELGLAKAYRLSHTAATPLDGMPPASWYLMRPDEWYYFYATKAGLRLLTADWDWDGWPYDENGTLRPDWSPPR